MMPTSFVVDMITLFSKPGDVVLDPFCGRGTVPFVAATLGRSYFGIEIFPVGWIYSTAKCKPASERLLTKRLEEIGLLKSCSTEDSRFFRMAYAPRTLEFLCAARDNLNWRNNQVDRTLMALILICLHDKRYAGLSNQMRQTKAVHPDYAVQWWRRNHMLKPPSIDPVVTLKNKIKWRYAKGLPSVSQPGNIYFGDCIRVLSRSSRIADVKLLFTSPPYYGVTNYFVDQWIRNWMLGGPPQPCAGNHPYKRRFNNKEAYRDLLERSFTLAAQKLRSDAIVLVRTDAREFTLSATCDVLRKVFPKKKLVCTKSPLNKKLSQTALFGDKKKKPGEVDILLN